jgi:predicted DsbA family dithiol-disulfide isomerase
MSKAGLKTAQMLPQFLLPRLSWQQAGPIQRQSLRALSTLPSTSRSNDRSSSVLVRSRQDVLPRPKSSVIQTTTLHRAFHATAPQYRDHHFDTLKFVQRLQEEGFTEAQSVAMMKVLSDVIEERSTSSLQKYGLN